MNKKFAKVISLLMVFTMLLTACGGGNNSANESDESTEVEGKILYTANHSEPGSLDPAMAQGTHESFILNHLYTGLLAYDKDGKLAPGMADMPTVSDDGMVYTFTIRDGMKWSNGDPVIAQDFEFEWLRVLNPETASEYAYQLYYVKGGQAYNSTEMPGTYYVKDDDGKETEEIDHEVKYTAADTEGLDIAGKSEEEVSKMVYEKWLSDRRSEVGVKVIDDKTLEVTLENPTPYFLDITAFYTLYPVNSKIVAENPDWATGDISNYVSNGAFKLKSWEHDNMIKLVKNENWFDAENVKLAGINFDILEDINTCWQNYDSGKYSMLTDPPQEVVAQKFGEKNEELIIGKQVGTYYYNLNNVQTGGEVNPFTNKNIRKAFVYALDREAIVNNISKGGQIAATGMVPFGLVDDEGKDFRETNGTLIEFDVDKAKEYFQKGLDELGLKAEDLNGKVILYNTSEGHKKIAQAVQQMWKETLGVDLGLENVDFNVKIAREHAGDFEISRMGWVGDYSDPMTMLDLFVTGASMNDSRYENPKYDELIAKAKATGDQKVRMDSMKEAEKILMEDLPIVPIYFYTLPYFVKSDVKGIYKPLLQYPILTYAEIGE